MLLTYRFPAEASPAGSSPARKLWLTSITSHFGADAEEDGMEMSPERLFWLRIMEVRLGTAKMDGGRSPEKALAERSRNSRAGEGRGRWPERELRDAERKRREGGRGGRGPVKELPRRSRWRRFEAEVSSDGMGPERPPL